ncbi:MAG: hypothetical protein NXI12_10420 [Alphaproteobacteria bacterium]|nr:hypothetical protein [Alphaproteobacteria bacterium]
MILDNLSRALKTQNWLAAGIEVSEAEGRGASVRNDRSRASQA